MRRTVRVVVTRCPTRVALGALALASTCALATPGIMNAWSARYPGSTLALRTEAATGDSCFVCHSPPSFGSKGNCYRRDLRTLLQGGMSNAQAIEALDTIDSDGDGVSNGEEIIAPRADMPGHVGFNPGLIGPQGVSPCSQNTSLIVTHQLETPPPCPANLDDGTGTGTPDGGVDINDLLYFLTMFDLGDLASDLDDGNGNGIPDGGVDINDLLFFLAHFELGC